MRNPLTSDQRYREARSIDRLLMDASRPRRPGALLCLPVHQRSVVLACAEPLVEIAAVLRDPDRVVGDALGRRRRSSGATPGGRGSPRPSSPRRSRARRGALGGWCSIR
jgi:hypothetical protein